YDLDNNLVATDLPNGTVETRQYDALDRLVSLQTATAGGWVISSDHYTLGPDGSRWSVVETASNVGNTAHTARTVYYSYDALDRLTQEWITTPGALDFTYDYAYDLAGNRLKQTKILGSPTAPLGATELDFFYDANDLLVTETGDEFAGGATTSTNPTFTAVNATYLYDANGSTLSVSGTGVDQTTYTWDVEGRMIGATVTAQGTNATYTYDDAGDRVSQTVGGTTTTYLNDPNGAYDQVLEEYTGGMLAATYVRGLDLLFRDRTTAGGGTGLSFYAKDGPGEHAGADELQRCGHVQVRRVREPDRVHRNDDE
ncbi:MAG: hypothetical protein P4L84_24390, partial [Isosphaeraceae bacterium]|nr:hypothetical protein [Isosphaeraceae bacterium]